VENTFNSIRYQYYVALIIVAILITPCFNSFCTHSIQLIDNPRISFSGL